MVNHHIKNVVREWYWQRLSAIILALLLPAAFFFMLCLRSGSLTYTQCLTWMSHTPVQIWHSTLIIAFSLHLWIGIKIILEDYVALQLRIPALAITSLCLVGMSLWGLKITWWIGS